MIDATKPIDDATPVKWQEDLLAKENLKAVITYKHSKKPIRVILLI